MIKTYLRLTKPGVMLGNLITTIAGYLLAASGVIDWLVFIAAVFGTALIISSACVINNVLDQDIDAKMERTKDRPLITGEADSKIATLFGSALGFVGIAILLMFTNLFVVIIGIFGFIVYVWLYGALSKRKSMHGTLIGSISGAMPILAGYVAAKGYIDTGALIVFAILFIWQIPEFYSIAIYRRREYLKAGVPVVSVIKGNDFTKKSIIFYLLLLIPATLSLSIFNYTGYSFFIVMAAILLYWLLIGISEKKYSSIEIWAKKMFKISLIFLLAFCLLISVENLLP